MKKRLLAGLLCAALFCGLAPRGFAADAANEGLCEHHTEHTEDCGYSEGVAGSPCAHAHEEDCYVLEKNCVHLHDETCYPAQTAADNAAPPDVDEADPTECTHVCSEESGCITKKLNCTHSHDETCGYVEAAAGTPCDYDCSICAELALDSADANLSSLREASQTVTIEVEGEKTWEEIEAAMDEVVEKNPGAGVKIVGTDSDATIVLSGLNEDVEGLYNIKAIELQSDTAFENVTLQMVDETAQEPNIAIFANGHNLYVAETVKTGRSAGIYTKNMYIFGGGNQEATENTHIEINGGDWARIYGGSYRADSGDTYVHVAGDAAVLSVYGGCYGGVTTGNIVVEYGANRQYFSNISNDNYRLAYVIGSGHDIQNETQIADTTGDKIEIRILPGALLHSVYGGLNSMISSEDVYVTVEEGAAVTTTVSGGAVTSSDPAERYSLASGYWPRVKQYKAASDIHVLFNGEGRADDTEYYSSSIIGGGVFGDVTGNIDVTVNGNTEYVTGGSQRGDVTGNINITINGGVYAGGHNADGAIGNVTGYWYGGTVTGGCLEGTVTGDITTTINKNAEVHAVTGGSDDGGVVGNTAVHVYGTILKKNYEKANRALKGAGCVYGGGYLGSSSCIDSTDVSGKAQVYIYEGACVQGDVYGGGLTARCSGGTSVFVSGTVCGDVYGGSWLQESTNQYGQYELGYVGETYIELNGNGFANDVYGGGRIGNVYGGSTVLLKDNAKVNNVYGTGNAYTTFYSRGTEYTFGPIDIETTGNVKIQIQDMAAVTDTVYGYGVVEIAGTEKKLLSGKAEVFFNNSNNNAVFKRVENADLVQVTDNSNVTIDNNHQDDEQLVNVSDLTIDGSAVLELGASAHILGDYRGDTAQSGTLKIPAGECLTADGTVTDLTKISILDNEIDNVVPKEAQVYVISGEGSTTDDGDFTWIDTRNGVYMDWLANEDGTTQWWLVKDPDQGRHGGLTVTKRVSGSGASTSQTFTFTVTMGGAVSGTFGDMTFHNGAATFPLKHGESMTAQNLPAGISYTVTEDAESGYTAVSTGESGKIEAGETAKAVFTNTKNAVSPDPDPKPDPKPDPDPDDDDDDDEPKLNTDDHYSYIIGYKDGYLRPYGTITRGEVATIFFRLLTDETRDKYWSQVNPYSDCNSDLWCNNAISTLTNMGIIDGFTDGTFRPYGRITRAQFSKIAVGFFETTAKEYQGYYSDVPENAWFTDYVEAASRMGLIQGFEDGTFRPNINITRAQACVIVNRALDRKPDEDHLLPERIMVIWPDNNPGDWYYADMQEATNSHDYTWLTKGSDRKYMENWTRKLEQRDWAAFEHAWSTAHSAPGGEVVK